MGGTLVWGFDFGTSQANLVLSTVNSGWSFKKEILFHSWLKKIKK
jgi:hypothetical protein